jgi:glycine cleavage system aminomethyltransferase T/glycine/D-amino acid oxidase-like deaminating enzyme
VIGAGVVGCSAAYHLTQHGETDVTVVDMGDIEIPGGSTVHAPGGLVETSSSRIMSQFATYSRRLYSELDAYRAEGLLELATTDARCQQAKRLYDYSRSWDIPEGELLSSGEMVEHVPLLDDDPLVGGFLSPEAGLIRPVELLRGLRERAGANGATFHGQTKVTDIETAGDGVAAVVTDRGRISVDQVLVAANIWSPLFGAMVDVDIPLMPCEHQYVVTEPLPELAGTDAEVEYTGFRHQDAALYFRQHGEGYGVGSYNHEPLLVDPEDLDDYASAEEDVPIYDYLAGKASNRDPVKMTAQREFTPEHFEEAWAEATRVMPALEGADLEQSFNGMFCFTPDGMPIMGSPPDLDGFWVAAAVWLTHAGGVGKAMAEWITSGYPRQNLVPCDINRFQPHAGSQRYVRDRAAYSYDTVYDLIHPRQLPDVNQNLRTGPFYDRQADLGAEFYSAGGWERARWYDDNQGLLEAYDVRDRSGWVSQYWSPIEGAEHLAVRDRVGVFDLSAFTNIEVSGPDVEAFLDRVCTNSVDIGIGDVTYTLMCTRHGGVLGDMTLLRRGQDVFELFANSGAAGIQQLSRLRRHAQDQAVTVSGRVPGRSALGVWGPNARELLAPRIEADLGTDAFPYFTAQETYLEEIPVTAIRVSYVGELGWELHTTTEYGRKLWEVLWEAGQDHGLVAMGDGALNTMRLEKGYPLFGGDLTPEYDPYEARLGFTVDQDTPFIGREAVADAAGAVTRQRTTLTLDEPGAVVGNSAPILAGDEVVGYAASAEYGHSVDAGIISGYLDSELADSGTSLEVQYENERYPATVRDSPLLDPERERLLG